MSWKEGGKFPGYHQALTGSLISYIWNRMTSTCRPKTTMAFGTITVLRQGNWKHSWWDSPIKDQWLRALLAPWITVLLTRLLPYHQNAVSTFKFCFQQFICFLYYSYFFTASAICHIFPFLREKNIGLTLPFPFPATEVHFEAPSWWLRFCCLLRDILNVKYLLDFLVSSISDFPVFPVVLAANLF